MNKNKSKNNTAITQKKKPGVKQWQPSEEQKKIAQKLIEDGLPLTDIAKSFNVSNTAFNKHFTAVEGVGKRAHAVTESNKKKVVELAELKLTQEQIGTILDISVDTLTKYYKKELELGNAKSTMSVSRTIFDMAINEKNEKMLTLIAKTKMGWKENQGLELTGKDGNSIEINQSKSIYIDSLTKRLNKDLESEVDE